MKTAIVKPKGDWIVYKKETIELSSGIILPDSSKATTGISKYIVKAIGPQVRGLKVGKEICILPRQLVQLKEEAGFEAGLFMIRQEDVIGEVKRK